MNYNDIVIYLVKRLLTDREDAHVTIIMKDQKKTQGTLDALHLCAFDEDSYVSTFSPERRVLIKDIAYIEAVNESEVKKAS